MPTRITLPELKIASPCPARWADMRGDDRRRYCEACGRHVHNFAAMHDAEIAELLDGRPVCAQLHRRADGTILTADCPVGVRLARTRAGQSVLRAVAATTALAGVVATALGGGTIVRQASRSPISRVVDDLLRPAPLPGELNVVSGKLAPPPTTAPAAATQPIRGEVAVEPAAPPPSTRPAG